MLNAPKAQWELQSELLHIDIPSTTMFGERNAVKILGDVAFLGAASTESVFIFRRIFSSGRQKRVLWSLWMNLEHPKYSDALAVAAALSPSSPAAAARVVVGDTTSRTMMPYRRPIAKASLR